jgi:inorganic triphosphatase YgiF
MPATPDPGQDRTSPAVRPQSMREVETKFDIPGDFAVPDLEKITKSDGRVDTDAVALSSTYHDTSTMQLLRFHLTLRKREATGATDDVGWQLKVPGSGFRTELHWPLDDNDAPPAELIALLRPFLGGREVEPAIRLDVTRARHRIISGDGALIAEIAHDDVQAVPLAAPVRASQWLELEVELGSAGDQSALERLDRIMRKAGASPSTSRSKLARAVAGVGNESVGGARSSAGAVLSEYVAAQVDAIIAGHFAIHEDGPDSVHQTRVACRRLRSTLRTFADCYDTDAASRLGDELQWYAAVLGSVRDREVLRSRLAGQLAELAPELVAGPAAQRIDERLAAELSDAREELLATFAGDRYAQLLERVVEWRDDPPFTMAAGRPAATLKDPVEHAQSVLDKRLDQATSETGTDAAMHKARKAGKRARYATEVVRAGKSGGRARRLQDLLGEFQDSVVAADALLRLADQARAAGEDTFTYGVLFADERARANAAREQARDRA